MVILTFVPKFFTLFFAFLRIFKRLIINGKVLQELLKSGTIGGTVWDKFTTCYSSNYNIIFDLVP
jgi:hypothetical protein